MTATDAVVVDWGSTHVRAWALDAAGAVLAEAAAPDGVAALAPGDFPAALARLLDGWALPAAPVLLAGMVGSRQGWHEAPYMPCPAAAVDALAGAVPVTWPGGRALILPGIRCARADGTPDLMRGEEVQVWGSGVADGTVVLPGTHSKWARVENGRITSFTTHVTGELFAVLRTHSLVGRGMGEPGASDAAFDRGVDRALGDHSLGRLLFGARSEVLGGGLAPGHAGDYLSGLLIGAEVHAERAAAVGGMTLVGAPALAARYQRALARAGAGRVGIVDGGAAVRCGLFALHRRAREE